MDYRKLSARSRHHAQATNAIEDFKKASRPARGVKSRGRKNVDPGSIEVWFADEARASARKNKITSTLGQARNASAPSDQRTASTYTLGAICPKEGKAVGLIPPKCNTEAMQLHLWMKSLRMSRRDAMPSCFSIRRDGTCPGKLDVPGNLTLVSLPAKCPELNSTENIWEFMRDNWLSNRVFLNADDLLDHCCEAWNKLRSQPWRLMSIGMRDWAHKF